MTPLHFAAEAGHVDVVHYLVKDAAADVTAVDKVSPDDYLMWMCLLCVCIDITCHTLLIGSHDTPPPCCFGRSRRRCAVPGEGRSGGRDGSG